jgi:hypothetical protein
MIRVAPFRSSWGFISLIAIKRTRVWVSLGWIRLVIVKG